MTTTLSATSLPFDEAIAYLGGKANVTSQDHTDIWGKANVKSFTVAGATTQALVDDFRAEVAKALENGTSLQEFRKGFDALVTKHGWDHTGSPGWRSRIIFETNLGMAYSAGRYAQQTEPETLAAFPFWQYVHSGARHPRKQHLAWNGLCLRADDPFWETHYPPNGWRCGCRTRPLSARGMARQGKTAPDKAPPLDLREHVIKKTGEVIKVPAGIDPGFDYNPGREWTGRAPEIPANATLTVKPPSGPAPAALQPAPAAPSEDPVTVIPTKPAAPGQPIPPPSPPKVAPAPSQPMPPAPTVAPTTKVPALPKLPLPQLPPGLKPAMPSPAAPIPKLPPEIKPPQPAAPKPPPAVELQPAVTVSSTSELRAADEMLHKDFSAWGEKLTHEQSSALRAYKGSAYRIMNEHLRGRREAPSMESSIRALDTALGKAKTKRPVTVHRGMKPGTAWDTVKVGDTVHDPGFTSTSINPATARNFSGGPIIEVRLPQGYSGGAYVQRIPDLDHSEFEFLIRPGMPFKVVERTGNRIVVEPVRGGRRRSPKLA